jgi:aspartate aminotransferase
MEFAKRVERIQSSKTVSISNTVLRLKKEGHDVISFGAGEPDFPTPDFIRDAAIAAIRAGRTKYTQVMGIPELRQAVAEKLRRENGVDYAPDQITITTGGKQALFNAVLSLCEAGDEVIIPTPCWVSYPEQVRFAGATPIFVEARPENDFRILPEDLKAAITPRTKLFIFNDPVNPTGAVYDLDTLTRMAEILAEAGIWILTDEIYEKIVFDGRKHITLASFPDIKDKVILVNGVSKAYSMTGWRIGYAAGNREIIAAMNKIQGHSTSNPNTVAQWASVAALQEDFSRLQWMVDAFQSRRDAVYERLQKMPGVRPWKSAGTFYIFPEIKDILGSTWNGKSIRNSFDLCTFLLEEEKVALIPGGAFGAEGFVRLSFATSMMEIQRGMDRLQEGLTKLYSASH